MRNVTIIGGGLAGIEVALFLSRQNIPSTIFEQRPKTTTEAHKTHLLGELVCSNSLKSTAPATSSGMLKGEMAVLGSEVLKGAQHARIPAGNALAVDRHTFAQYITNKIESDPNITLVREEVTTLKTLLHNNSVVVIATGPLTKNSMMDEITTLTGSQPYFYDAISPIIETDSINMAPLYKKNRYDKGGADYINIPLTEQQYDEFYNNLMTAEKTELANFEQHNVYEGCMPIEIMAARGKQTLLFGPMKPVGLETPDGTRPHAVIQLRQENKDATAYNIVGFQTKMKIGEQKRVLQKLPGLENANFFRYGSIHRNTYIQAPQNLTETLQLRSNPNIFFAGQITGVEGYMESAATGLIVGMHIANIIAGESDTAGTAGTAGTAETTNTHHTSRTGLVGGTVLFPAETALGALSRYVSGQISLQSSYSPSNFNYGMLPPLTHDAKGKRYRDKQLKRTHITERGMSALLATLHRVSSPLDR